MNYRDALRDRAEKAFQNHELTKIADYPEVQVWRCGRPNTIIYGFRITVLKNLFILDGDIGFLSLKQNCQSPENMIHWVAKSCRSTSYLLEKIPFGAERGDLKTFNEEAFKEMLQTLRDEGEMYGGDQDYDDIAERLETEVIGAVETWGLDSMLWMQPFYEIMDDAGFVGSEWIGMAMDYKPGVLWCVQGIEKFCKLWVGFKGPVHEG